MDTLLEITLRSNLVEKLSMALYDCLFEEDQEDSSSASESKVLVAYLLCVYAFRVSGCVLCRQGRLVLVALRVVCCTYHFHRRVA
jgi:hypothetical protein